MFQEHSYLGIGGLQLNIPFIRRETAGWFPTVIPSTSGWVVEIDDLKVFIVWYCRAESNWSVKNSIILATVAETGSIFRLEHHLRQAVL